MRQTHKYGAKPKTLDGIRFASTAEARRYAELRLLEKAGEISYLELQPRFPLHVSSETGLVHVGTYIGDFQYFTEGRLVVEDVKGFRTTLFKLKLKMVEAEYRVKVTEIR